MKLKILSFSGEAFKTESAHSVTLMTKAGEITVLEDHFPLITSMNPGTMYVEYMQENGAVERKDFAVGGGIVEVSEGQVKILSDMLVDVESVDRDEAEEARQKALALMEKFKNSKDQVEMDQYIQAQDALLKSVAQLKLHKMKQ